MSRERGIGVELYRVPTSFVEIGKLVVDLVQLAVIVVKPLVGQLLSNSISGSLLEGFKQEMEVFLSPSLSSSSLFLMLDTYSS